MIKILLAALLIGLFVMTTFNFIYGLVVSPNRTSPIEWWIAGILAASITLLFMW